MVKHHLKIEIALVFIVHCNLELPNGFFDTVGMEFSFGITHKHTITRTDSERTCNALK